MTDSPPRPLDGKRLILGVSGSIAAYKSAELIRRLRESGAEIQVVMTRDAQRFIPALTLGTVSESEVLIDIFPENASGSWTKHVQLGLWADLFLLAPASATTLSKLAHGACDNMLTAVALSRRCPMLVCPAMDHDMFHHPATQRNLDILQQDGVLIMEPDHGSLASGLIGDGRMPQPDAIVRYVESILAPDTTYAGAHVLITAGPTREHIDPVRFLSNPATGTTGFALASEAAKRGAKVTLIAGPTDLPTPQGAHRIDVVSADDMYEAAMAHQDADIIIGTAAVADFTPAHPSDRKVKKEDGDLGVEFRKTHDILAELGKLKRKDQLMIGFALETHDEVAHAREKLTKKNLDLIILNNPSVEGSGFGTGTNRISFVTPDGGVREVPQQSKAGLAHVILDEIVRIRNMSE